MSSGDNYCETVDSIWCTLVIECCPAIECCSTYSTTSLKKFKHSDKTLLKKEQRKTTFVVCTRHYLSLLIHSYTLVRVPFVYKISSNR